LNVAANTKKGWGRMCSRRERYEQALIFQKKKSGQEGPYHVGGESNKKKGGMDMKKDGETQLPQYKKRLARVGDLLSPYLGEKGSTFNQQILKTRKKRENGHREHNSNPIKNGGKRFARHERHRCGAPGNPQAGGNGSQFPFLGGGGQLGQGKNTP